MSTITPDQFDTAGNWICPSCKTNTGSPRGYKSHGCEVQRPATCPYCGTGPCPHPDVINPATGQGCSGPNAPKRADAPRSLRKDDTPEGKKIWDAVDTAAARAPQWVKDALGGVNPADAPRLAEPSEAAIEAAIAAIDTAFTATDYEFENPTPETRTRATREWWGIVLRAAYAVDEAALRAEQDPNAHPCPARRWDKCCPYPSVCRDKQSCVDSHETEALRAERETAPRLAETEARLEWLGDRLHEGIPTEQAVAHHYEIGREAIAIARSLVAALRAERESPEGPWRVRKAQFDAGYYVFRGDTGKESAAVLFDETEALAVRDALNRVSR